VIPTSNNGLLNQDSIDGFRAKTFPVIDTISSNGSLTDHDTRLTALVPFVMEEIDPIRFRAVLQGLLNTKTRLPSYEQSVQEKSPDTSSNHVHCKKEDTIHATRTNRGDILHDNIVHCHAFFDRLIKQAGMLPDSEGVNRTWLRLFAIIAICFGGTSEPAFFLTMMDRQLGILRRLFDKEICINYCFPGGMTDRDH
jgi:hypothetical protein